MPTYLTDDKEIYDLYKVSSDESKIWRKDYQEFERLADNELIPDLDDTLPEVNDGSLAASLYKLPKRIVNSELSGKVKALDRDESWVSELANIVWRQQIVPNANSQAPFIRKWKDAVRKAAIYGSVPIITLFVERGDYTGADFIVAQPQDVKLEPGKVSDYDSDVIFWDVYFSKLQVRQMLDRAKDETKQSKKKGEDGYNTWYSDVLQQAIDDDDEEERDQLESHNAFNENSAVKPKGIKFCVVQQRGVTAPYYMYYRKRKNVARKWSNQDPSGDMQIHFLYCYQDFVNPYGTGIVKLAGGTQNVLDYMRQADVLATQIGIRPPVNIAGDTSKTDLDSMVYEQDAQWITGNATVERMELGSHIYTELPNRINMYKTSLNNLLPMGDTSVSSDSGDPLQSKTPAGVKFAQANLSIDDEDFKDNFYMTYGAVAKSMINVHFANMQGSDLMKLPDEDRTELIKAGMPWPQDENGDMSNELEVIWDTVRAQFEYEVDPSSGVKTNDQEQLVNIQEALKTVSPQVNYYLGQDGWKFNLGEAYRSLFNKMNLDNVDDIISKMTDEEAAEAKKQPFPIIDPPVVRLNGMIPNSAMDAVLENAGVQTDASASTIQDTIDIGDIIKDPTTTLNEKAQIKQMAGIQPDPNAVEVQPTQPAAHDQSGQAPADTQQPQQQPALPENQPDQQPVDEQQIIQQLMHHYGVDEGEAKAMRAAELQGAAPEEILAGLKRHRDSKGAAQ
jgi:hypothetical protein